MAHPKILAWCPLWPTAPEGLNAALYILSQVHNNKSSQIRLLLSQARKVTFYRNGDQFFKGLTYAVKPILRKMETFRAFEQLLADVRSAFYFIGPLPGLPWGLDFNPNTHPMPTEKPVGIPTESTYPQNPKILHMPTYAPLSPASPTIGLINEVSRHWARLVGYLDR